MATRTPFVLEVILDGMAPDEGHEIEDAIDSALTEANLGKVTGGGTGSKSSKIDVEITDLARGIQAIRQSLSKAYPGPVVTIVERSSPPLDPDSRQAFGRFIEAFEQVFHHDWSYTKSQLGITSWAVRDAEEHIRSLFGEALKGSAEKQPTLLHPGSDDTSDNWGHYQALLDAYAQVKRLLR